MTITDFPFILHEYVVNKLPLAHAKHKTQLARLYSIKNMSKI